MTRQTLARLLLAQLGRTPADELALVVIAAGRVPALGLALSDRRQRHLAEVRRAVGVQRIGAVEAVRVAGGLG